MQDTFSVAASLLGQIFGLRVRRLDDRPSYAAFCRSDMLLPVQQFYAPDNLWQLADSLPESDACCVRDQLQIELVLFRAAGQCILLGPFCTRLFSRGDCMQLLKKLGLPTSLYTSLLAYRDRFPMLAPNTVLDITRSLTRVLTDREYGFHTVDFSQVDGEAFLKAEENTLRRQYAHFIGGQYAAEQRFMQRIEAGDKTGAIAQLQQMQRGFQSFKKLGTTLENERVAAAIVRTMVRVAAMRVGLPTLAIDQLSRANTVAIQKATRVDEIYAEKEKMVASFCEEIRRHREQGYGNLVSSVLFYMEHQYDEPITVAQLAREFHVSQNHLTTQFHRETGETPTDRLRKIRTREAQQLLLTTGLSVQKISEKIGIADSNYFVKLFRKDFGMTPTQYRRRYKP